MDNNIVLLLIFVCITLLGIYGCKDGFLPLSGSEPKYNPSKWNKMPRNNNCYAYMLDDLEARGDKPQPGFFGGNKDIKYNCKHVMNNILLDNKHIYKSKEHHKCRRGYYKAYLALDPKGEDYHFYRQDSNGLWSHKAGNMPVSNKDSKKNNILNPRIAEKVNKPYHYTKNCNYFCVPANYFQKTNSHWK